MTLSAAPRPGWWNTCPARLPSRKANCRARPRSKRLPRASRLRSIADSPDRIYEHNASRVPEPLNDKDLRAWAGQWAADILKLETERLSLVGAGVKLRAAVKRDAGNTPSRHPARSRRKRVSGSRDARGPAVLRGATGRAPPPMTSPPAGTRGVGGCAFR